MTAIPTHLYDPNVPGCSEHDMGDYPHHKGGPCVFSWEGELCGQAPKEHGRPVVDSRADSVWTPGTRLPITGDAVGPEILSWLIADRTTRMGGGSLTAHVEQIETIERDGR